MTINSTTVFRQINPFADLNEVRNTWIYLSSLSSHSFFISWGWIEAWITTLPKTIEIRFIVGMHDDRPVFAFFYGKKTTIRHLFAVSRGIYLNTTGDSHYDSIFIEYNSIVFDPSYTLSAEDLQNLPFPNWDEFIMPGIVLEQNSIIKHIFDELKRNRNTVIYMKEKSYYVDLESVRKKNNDYFSMLSSNRRQQIRRSIREYEKEGTIHIEAAEGLVNARHMFDNMVTLHQTEWNKRGKPGAFANEYLCRFHATLIENRFKHNEIQLLHIYNDKETIGYLYNFVYNHKVMFYQGGFSYKSGNKYRPGTVSHYYAIIYNAKENNLIYDFLAGDSPYKESLSSGYNVMESLRIQKPRPQFIVENCLKKCKAMFRNIRNHQESGNSSSPHYGRNYLIL